MTSFPSPVGNKINEKLFQEIGLNSPGEEKKEKSQQTQFLDLFVAQLKNQNPLDPKEGADFLAQLAQFSTVEGIQNMQSSISNLAKTFQSNSALQATSLVGKNVFTKTNESTIKSIDQPLKGIVNIPAYAQDVQISIRDEAGALHKQFTLGNLSSGEIPFHWQGGPGTYSVQASGIVDGKNTNLDTYISSNVDSVTIPRNGGGLLLNIEGVGTVPLDEVKTIG
jgi:flagellar basal-body rod modification protein FlgD